MALTTIGRESSLSTFSCMLAQPAERIRIWQTKLSVLAVAFLIVFVVWLVAFGIAFFNSSGDADAAENSYNLFITICLVGTATFTGGLWTTLLLRQIAGAFWLTLLIPAVLAGFTAGFLAANHSDNIIIAVLCVVLGIYSVGGFLFARWLFFRAQDVGWSGGNIELPEWKIFAGSDIAVSTRSRKPIFALFKKELQLHQVTLMGAVGLLVLHIGILVLRKYHHFAKDSAGEVLTSIVWLLWLVMPVVIGSMAVAEERRLGVMEGQLCLPVSRRVQFAIKGILTLLLGTFLGGIMPMLLESIGVGLGANSEMFNDRKTIRQYLFCNGHRGARRVAGAGEFLCLDTCQNFPACHRPRHRDVHRMGHAHFGIRRQPPAFLWFVPHKFHPAAGHLDADNHCHPALAGVFELQKFPRRLAFVAAQPSWLCWSAGFYRREQRGDLQPRLGSF